MVAGGAGAILFSEPLFLFVFLPCVLAAYVLFGRGLSGRFLVLLLASLAFYSWGEPAFVPVVLLSAALDYWLGRRIARGLAGGGRGWALPVGVALNVMLLFYYKYLSFAAAALAWAADWPMLAHLPAVALPIGVSFIVFEKITYLVDIARGRSQPAPGFASYVLYVLFFPKLLAGPIIQYHDIDGQFRALPAARWEMVLQGFSRFMVGLVKKVLLADILGAGADAVFALPAGSVGFAGAWSGVGLFTLQIYLDFSAYSDMAIGLAGMFGLRLAENFNWPYVACSLTEFWRRWHISLTRWIRDYLYIPLGGSRQGLLRTYINLWLCFLLSGLWHGAAWTFVAWGAYNGAVLVCERVFLLRLLDRLPRLLANAFTVLVIMAGWTIFRARSGGQAASLLGAMIDPWRTGGGLVWQNDMRLAACVAGIGALGPLWPGVGTWVAKLRRAGLAQMVADTALLLLFVVAVSRAMADPFRPFLYFRF